MFAAAAYLSYMRKLRRELDDMRFGRKAMEPDSLERAAAAQLRNRRQAAGFDRAA